uniref:Uncharacterized protein n=1 Tax=Anguilla anguilla TaxID=7936 RepID=A0A0E9R0Q7_ANGAN
MPQLQHLSLPRYILYTRDRIQCKYKQKDQNELLRS